MAAAFDAPSSTRIAVFAGTTAALLGGAFLAHRLLQQQQHHHRASHQQQHNHHPQEQQQQSTWGALLAQLAPTWTTKHQPQQQHPEPLWEYAQSHEELLVEVANLPPHLSQEQVAVSIADEHLTVRLGPPAAPPLIDAALAGRVSPEASSWRLEGRGSDRKLSITLAKAPPQPPPPQQHPGADGAAGQQAQLGGGDRPHSSGSSGGSRLAQYDIWATLLKPQDDDTGCARAS